MNDTRKPEDYPNHEDFVLLLQDLRRRIEKLLRREERTPETDSPLLRETVLAITQHRRLDGIEKTDPPESESPSSKGPRE